MVEKHRLVKSNHQKLYDQFKWLKDIPNSIIQTISPNDNEYRAHTLFKLAFLNYYMGIFFPIAKKNFDHIIYMDLLAGSGLVKIRDRDCYVKGSVLLAATSKYSFSKIICCEINESRAILLKKRLDILKSPNEVIQGDINNKIDDIISKSEISKDSIILLFIDPEGMEVKLEILKKIMERTKYVDIILNYNYGIERMKGRTEIYQNDADINRMQAMSPGYKPGDDPSILTMDYLTKELGRQIGKKVDICRDSGKPEYSLIIRTRRTYFGSEWLEPLDSIINFISQCNGNDAARILDQVCGNQRTLDYFE